MGRRPWARAVAVVLVAGIVATACGGAMATPTSTAASAATPWPTNSPSPSQATSPSPIGSPAEFEIAMGKAGLLDSAADNGLRAGTEINDFGFDLLRRLDTSGNLCASPTSIALALAMVRPGARGVTATEMDKVLHEFGSTGQADEIVALLKALQSQTVYDDSNFYSDDPQATPDHSTQSPAVELNVSNAVFSQKGMNLQQAYLESLSSGFGAGLGLLDYKTDPEAARQIINRWASDRTPGRIPEILKPGDIKTKTRIALANAIYLKAGWTFPFDPTTTKSLPFTRADGSRASVQTMAMDRQLSYSTAKGYRAVQLPFGGGRSSLSMTIVVPDDMTSFVKGLTEAKLGSIDSQGKAYDVDLTLPRFSAESRIELSSVLKAMGMPTLFSGQADLSGITTDEKLYIDRVIHQANIDVVEEGTTASAVTVAVGATMGGGLDESPPPHVQFHVDKPFLYFIREQSTGAILFMGRIDDPSVKS
ncbi:MAG TPA: serpin family protein, partial [Candidatus Limnocylindrales bacterium]